MCPTLCLWSGRASTYARSFTKTLRSGSCAARSLLDPCTFGIAIQELSATPQAGAENSRFRMTEAHARVSLEPVRLVPTRQSADTATNIGDTTLVFLIIEKKYEPVPSQ